MQQLKIDVALLVGSSNCLISVCWNLTPPTCKFMIMNVLYMYNIWENNETMYIDDTSENIIQVVSF